MKKKIILMIAGAFLLSCYSYGAEPVEPMKYFNCDVKIKLNAFDKPQLNSASKKIECHDISALEAPGPGVAGAIDYLLVWDEAHVKSIEWLKIKMKEKDIFLWVKKDSIHNPVYDLNIHLRRKDTYFGILENKWDKKLYNGPNSKKFIDLNSDLKQGNIDSETVEIESIRYLSNKVWIKVNIFDGSLCDPPTPPKKMFSGWVHLLNDHDEPIIFNSFCG